MKLVFNLLSITIVSQLCLLVKSETKMMVVWGEPDSTKYTKKNTSLSWDECIDECFNAQECVMAWESNQTCLIYNYYSISSVSQTDSAYGSVVAWKVNSPDDQCPTGNNPPTFDNQNATGTLFVEGTKEDWPMYVYYNIYMDGDKWKMSYSANRSCGNTFIEIVNHQDGSGLCTFEWYNFDNTSFSYDRGIELCEEKVAYLAGLVYPEDFAWFQDYASENLRSLINTPDSYARIDGKRTTACQTTPTTPECMSVAGFDFTGPPVPHFDNYNWVTNPSAMATPDDNCLVIVFKGNESPKVDVRGCSSNTSPLSTQFLFCSHTAWTYEAVDYD